MQLRMAKNQLVVMADLKEGAFQPCQGYLMRRTKYLKRWRRQYINIVPSKNMITMCGYVYREYHIRLIFVVRIKVCLYIIVKG